MQGQVVIINFPDTGHINPTLPLVAELASRVKVTYFLPQQFRSVVEAAGASWRPLQRPHEMTEESSGSRAEMLEHYLHPDAPAEEFEFPLCTLAVAAWILPDLISELRAMQPAPGQPPHVDGVQAYTDAKSDNPAGVIVYDPFLPHGLVAAHVLGIPAVSTVTHPGPGTMPHPPQLIEEWERHAVVRRARREIIQQYDFDVFAQGTLMEFYSPDLNLVTTIPEFFAPPRLSPQLKRFGNFPFHCVGPLVNTKLKRVAHAALDSAEAPVPWDVIDQAIAQSKRLVFLSMGTVATGNQWSGSFGPLAAHNGIQNCTGKEFLQRVWRIAFEALADEEDLLVLMVVGPKADAMDALPEAPSNFIIRQTVPQLDVLKRCRAFITHGGNNSIHEALAFAVPMAVIPMFGDQPYNSDAIASLRCGFSFRYPLQTLSAERLRKAVRGLLMEPSYHCAAMQMSQKLCCASGAKGAVEAILRTTSQCHLAGA